jgi:hypothetical protein
LISLRKTGRILAKSLSKVCFLTSSVINPAKPGYSSSSKSISTPGKTTLLKLAVKDRSLSAMNVSSEFEDTIKPSSVQPTNIQPGLGLPRLSLLNHCYMFHLLIHFHLVHNSAQFHDRNNIICQSNTENQGDLVLPAGCQTGNITCIILNVSEIQQWRLYSIPQVKSKNF